MDSVIGIILAAGGSSRMGRPKALLPLDGQPLIHHHIDQLGAVCEAIVVVIGGSAEDIRAVLPGDVGVVLNPDWSVTGPAESLRLALSQPIARAIITPVDVPPAPRPVLDAILASGGPAVPMWQGQDGHPVVIDEATRGSLVSGGLLRDALVGARRVAVDWPDAVANLNRPAQWDAWLSARSAPE